MMFDLLESDQKVIELHLFEVDRVSKVFFFFKIYFCYF